MPAFIKTEKEEKVWARAKARVHEQYPNISEDSDRFWSLTTTIYKRMNKGNKNMRKSATGVVAMLMAKKAYVPLTQAAQEAMAGQQAAPQPGMPPQDPGMMGGEQAQMDPAMAQQQGMPQMPMDPAMMQGQDPSMMGQDPAMQGQQQPIPVVSGPNGEPIDAETGFMVVDFAQGIEQDPASGILMNKFTGEFMSPDGQPMPPEQAMQLMQQSAGMPMQGAAPQDPAMMGGQPPMDPSMMGGMPQQGGAPMPQDQAMMQQTASAEDPMAMMGQGMPMQGNPPIQGQLNEAAGMQIDPNTGLPIDPMSGMLVDPNSGNLIDPNTMQPVGAGQMPQQGAPTPEDGGAAQLMENIPGLQEFINSSPKQMEKLDKDMSRVMHDVGNMRTDLQRMDRNLVAAKDEMRTLYDRMDNCLATVEDIVKMLYPTADPAQQQLDPNVMTQQGM